MLHLFGQGAGQVRLLTCLISTLAWLLMCFNLGFRVPYLWRKSGGRVEEEWRKSAATSLISICFAVWLQVSNNLC
jgi:hypothetical protein